MSVDNKLDLAQLKQNHDFRQLYFECFTASVYARNTRKSQSVSLVKSIPPGHQDRIGEVCILLDRLGIEYTVGKKMKATSFTIVTKSHELLGLIYPFIYNADGEKYISPLTLELLDKEALAILMMHKGNISYRTCRQRRYYFVLMGAGRFRFEEMNVLSRAIRQKFRLNFNPTLTGDKRRKKVDYRLRLLRRDNKELFHIIKPYLTSSYKEKFSQLLSEGDNVISKRTSVKSSVTQIAI